MLIKYNILSKMSSIYDLKIFIQSNPKQELAAKVSSFSFKKYGFKNVEILRLNNVIELKNNLNNTYFRGGKKIVYNSPKLVKSHNLSFRSLIFYLCVTARA